MTRSLNAALRGLKGPGWPDVRGWALIGFFVLTAYLLKMIDDNPALLGIPSFMQFAGQLVTGGLLAAAAWLYSAVKGPQTESGPTIGPVETVNVNPNKEKP